MCVYICYKLTYIHAFLKRFYLYTYMWFKKRYSNILCMYMYTYVEVGGIKTLQTTYTWAKVEKCSHTKTYWYRQTFIHNHICKQTPTDTQAHTSNAHRQTERHKLIQPFTCPYTMSQSYNQDRYKHWDSYKDINTKTRTDTDTVSKTESQRQI